MKKCGIYAIVSPSGNQYIGSSIDITRRWRAHLSGLRNNKHHSPQLQRSWNRYGESQHQWLILEECEESQLLQVEQTYLDTLKPKYNSSVSAISPMKGRKHTDEAKQRMAQPGSLNGNYGKPLTPEQRQRLDRTGTRHTEETRAAYSEKRKGAGNSFYGRQHSEEAKTAIAKKNSEYRHTAEAISKISSAMAGSNNPNYGKKASPEKLAKMREGQLRAKAQPVYAEKLAAGLAKRSANLAAKKAQHV